MSKLLLSRRRVPPREHLSVIFAHLRRRQRPAYRGTIYHVRLTDFCDIETDPESK